MRSGCTPSIIPADGVMCLLNYTGFESTDPLRTAAAFVHNAETVNWKDYTPGTQQAALAQPLRRIALNLAAPGDHADPDGQVWFQQSEPDANKRQSGNAAGIQVAVTPPSPRPFSFHPLRMGPVEKDALNLVSASGWIGVESLTVSWDESSGDKQTHTVRLHFVEPDDLKPGQRVFDVSLQDRQVLGRFDVVKTAGGCLRAVVREFRGVGADGKLTISLKRKGSRPTVLCGVEIEREK
jgi:hypothetical protein